MTHQDASKTVARYVRRVPNAPRTPMRTIRLSDELWQALLAAAAKNNESASDVLRRAAETYVRKNK